MKISEAIVKLITIQELHGDIDICGHGHNADYISHLVGMYVKKFDDCDKLFVELDCDLVI